MVFPSAGVLRSLRQTISEQDKRGIEDGERQEEEKKLKSIGVRTQQNYGRTTLTNQKTTTETPTTGTD